MISAEEIKALTAKDEKTTMKTYLINIRDNADRKIYGDYIARNAAMSPILAAIECYDNWQIFQDKQQQAIRTLQTLLNQAAEVVSKYEDHFSNLVFFEAKYTCHKCGETEHMSALAKAFNETIVSDFKQLLAAIEPYVTKEGEDGNFDKHKSGN